MNIIDVTICILAACMLAASIAMITISIVRHNTYFWYKGFVYFLCGIASVVVILRESNFLVLVLVLLNSVCQVCINRIKED